MVVLIINTVVWSVLFLYRKVSLVVFLRGGGGFNFHTCHRDGGLWWGVTSGGYERYGAVVWDPPAQDPPVPEQQWRLAAPLDVPLEERLELWGDQLP